MSSAIPVLAAMDVRPQDAKRSGGEEPESGLFGAALGAELLRSEPERTEPDSENGGEAALYGEPHEASAAGRESRQQEAPAELSDRNVREAPTLQLDPVAVRVEDRVPLEPDRTSPEAPRTGISPLSTLRPEAGPAGLEPSPRPAGEPAEVASAVAPNADLRARGIEEPPNSTLEPAASVRPREEETAARAGAARSPSAALQARPERAEMPLGPLLGRPEEGDEPRPSAARPAAASPQAESLSVDRPLREVPPRPGGPSERESQRSLPEAFQARQLLDSEPRHGQARVSVAESGSAERGSDTLPVRTNAPPPVSVAESHSAERGSDAIPVRTNAPPSVSVAESRSGERSSGGSAERPHAPPPVAREGAGVERLMVDTANSRQPRADIRATADAGATLNVQAVPLPVGDLPLAELRPTHVSSLPTATSGSAGPESIPLQAEWLAARGGGNVRLRLHPPELGELELKVRVRGKTVEIVIAAQEGAARLLVQEHRDQLSQNLASRGLLMDHFEVRDLPSRDASTGREGSRDNAGGWQQPDDAGRSLRGRRAEIDGTDGLPAAVVGLAVQPPRSSSTEAVDLRV